MKKLTIEETEHGFKIDVQGFSHFEVMGLCNYIQAHLRVKIAKLNEVEFDPGTEIKWKDKGNEI